MPSGQLDEKNKVKEVAIDFSERWKTHVGFPRRDRSGGGYFGNIGENCWATNPDKDPKASSQLITKIKKEANKQDATISESYDKIKGRELHFDGGTTWSIHQLLTLAFGTGGSAWVFLKFVKPLILQWLKNRGGRSVMIKSGDHEIIVTGSNDIDKAVAALKALEANSS